MAQPSGDEKSVEVGKYSVKKREYLTLEEPYEIKGFDVEWYEERGDEQWELNANVVGRFLASREKSKFIKEIDSVARKINELKTGDLYLISYDYKPHSTESDDEEIDLRMRKAIEKMSKIKLGACLIWEKKDGSRVKFCRYYDDGDKNSDYSVFDEREREMAEFFRRIAEKQKSLFNKLLLEELKKTPSSQQNPYNDLLKYLEVPVDMYFIVNGTDGKATLSISNIEHPLMIKRFWEEAKDKINEVIQDIKHEAENYLTYNNKVLGKRYLELFDTLPKRLELSMEILKRVGNAIDNSIKGSPNLGNSEDAIIERLSKDEKVLKELDKGLNDYLDLLEKYGIIEEPGGDLQIHGRLMPSIWDISVHDETTNLTLWVKHIPITKEIEEEVEEEFKALKGEDIENLFA